MTSTEMIAPLWCSPLRADPHRQLSLVIGGHVDHGKSTIIGRLLADTGSLPEGKLDRVREMCARNSRPFEYAFLLDALKDEQAQGITIDSARVFFKTAQRPYIIIDAPGHVEFLRNMITGASRADAALLVIDAREGVQENSRRHGYMMSMLGIRELVVVVNKMDLVQFSRAEFERIQAEYRAFLAQLDVVPRGFIPASGREGDNIARRSAAMPWYDGPTVLEALDQFDAELPDDSKPFRMFVQDVYKFTQSGDDRRIIAGTVESGRVRIGDEVTFLPSGKRSSVQSIEAFNRAPSTEAAAGCATGFTLAEQVYVTRGELATVSRESAPQVSTRFRASVFWLGKSPLAADREYLLKLGTARVGVRLDAVHRVLDASTLGVDMGRAFVGRHEVAEVTFETTRAIALDVATTLPMTSRFVIVDDFDICGGGIVREVLPDSMSSVRDGVRIRDAKWEPSTIPVASRVARFGQRAALVLVTGSEAATRKEVARRVEQRLFDRGRLVYFLGIANVLYGVDADLPRDPHHRGEHLRRLSEVANLLLDAGMILIVTAAALTHADVELIETAVSSGPVTVLWIGSEVATDVVPGLVLPDTADLETEVEVWLERDGITRGLP